MKRKVIWRTIIALVYMAVAFGVISVSDSRFETVVLAILIQIYAATLYNFSIVGVATDVNNYAGFVRFRILATALGVTENEDGLLVDQEETLRGSLDSNRILIIIDQISHTVVSLYVLYKILAALFFA